MTFDDEVHKWLDDFDAEVVEAFLASGEIEAVKSIAKEAKSDYRTLAQNAIRTNQEFTTNVVSQALTQHNQYAQDTLKRVMKKMQVIDKGAKERIEEVYRKKTKKKGNQN